MPTFTKPSELPAAASVNPGASVPVDSGSVVEKATPRQIVDAGRPVASEAQAIAGVDNATGMTPLTTRQAMDAATTTPRKFGSVSILIDDVTLTYPSTPEGTYIDYGPHRGIVAASGATDHDLTTAGGLKVYVQPGSDGSYNAGAFGSWVAGADVSALFHAALEKMFAKRNARLTTPSGNYLLSSPVDAQWPIASGLPKHQVTIDCANTIFAVPVANTDGGVKITKHNNFQNLILRNLCVYSEHAFDGVTTGGYGIWVRSSIGQGDAGWGAGGFSEVTLENCKATSPRPAALGRWDDGIIVENIWYPRLRFCEASTRYLFDAPDYAKVYESGAGIKTLSCYSPEHIGCHAWGAFDKSFWVTDDDSPAFEFFSFTDCQGVGARVGCKVDHANAAAISATLKEPGGTWAGGHLNGHQSAFEISDHSGVMISGLLAYTTNPANASVVTYANAAFFRLTNTQDVMISGCTINFGGHYVSDTDCSATLLLAGTTKTTIFEGNRIKHNGVAVRNTATGVDNWIGPNNYKGHGAPSSVGVTKVAIDPSDLLRGPDIRTSLTPIVKVGATTQGGGNFSSQYGLWKMTADGHVEVELSFTQTALSGTGNFTVDLSSLPPPLALSQSIAHIDIATGWATAPDRAFISDAGIVTLVQKDANGNHIAPFNHVDYASGARLDMSIRYPISIIA